MGALPTLRAATDPGVLGGEYYGPRGPLGARGYPKPGVQQAIPRHRPPAPPVDSIGTADRDHLPRLTAPAQGRRHRDAAPTVRPGARRDRQRSSAGSSGAAGSMAQETWELTLATNQRATSPANQGVRAWICRRPRRSSRGPTADWENTSPTSSPAGVAGVQYGYARAYLTAACAAAAEADGLNRYLVTAFPATAAPLCSTRRTTFLTRAIADAWPRAARLTRRDRHEPQRMGAAGPGLY